VHPVPPTYDEIWNQALDYAAAIKAQDANALVTGPVTWGYPDLFNSAKDAAEVNSIAGGSDRAAHGDMPFVAWYLQQVCAHPLAGGKRLVDYLDLHYYPQGTNVALSDDDSTATAARRLKSLRELYDSTWVSDSWMGRLGDTSYHYSRPDLIPRVRGWIDQYCPGTKLAITEYNWGNDDTTSGAVAQAEAMAIFAREGVDMATRWVAPSPNTKGEDAFQIFLNYDGAKSQVQGDSVAATTSNIDQIGAYAFHGDGRTMVLLTNKDTVAHDVSVTLHQVRNATWKLFGFDATHTVHQIGPGGTVNGTSLTLTGLTPMSANLLVIPDNDEIFGNGFDLP
jgi:Glycoside hydrolase family 44